METGAVRRKPDTLVVRRTRISDEKQHIHQLHNKSFELTQVIHLLEDPLTANLKERHLFALKKLLRRSQIGFILKELTGIATILNICAEKAKDHHEYLPILCEALKICSLPFLKEKSSDELNYAKDGIEFLSHMGCLMRVPDADVRNQLVDTVKSFYNSVAPIELLDGLQVTSPGYRLQLLEHSDLAQTLLLSMAALENQPNIKLKLLQTLQFLSCSSDRNCVLMLNARGAETMCLHMNEDDPSNQTLLRSSDILWNLLERGCREEVTAQLNSMECILSLKEAFLHSFGYSDRQVTNVLLMIITAIAETLSSLLIESLFAKQLVVLATFPELKNHNPTMCNIKINYSQEDFQTKKLLLNLLVVMSNDSAVAQIYKEERVILALLTLMKPPGALSEWQTMTRDWSASQQEALQLQALMTLASITPLMLDNYMSCQGNTCLLLLLDWCVQQDAEFDHVNTVCSSKGWGDKKVQVLYCVRVLRSVTSTGDESVKQDLCDQGIINQLLGILMQMEANPDDDDVVTIEIMTDVQLILAVLCETDMHRKELFGSEGVEMVVHFLKKGFHKFYGGLGHNKLTLTTIDCVWSCIVGCYTTEDYFLAKGGVCLLLDLLSAGPQRIHCIILATVLELCENPNTLPHILTWRDKAGHTAPRILLQLWREEEAELNVSRNQHGGIADPQGPLLSLHQRGQEQQSLPSNIPSPAVLELSENLRAKIYSIFCKIGFQGLPGLSAMHYVTLSIVRRYLDFKVGEVWQEINRELSLEGVKPISPDQEALSTITEIMEDTARRVTSEQSSIMEQHEKEELSQEENMYTEIKARWKQQELTAKSSKSYGPKTPKSEILKVLSFVFIHTKLSHMKSDGMLREQLQLLIFFLTFVALYRR
uniref:Cilia- and flagella-associated protein 69 ARM repeats domain-containing protein n=1 Tax=Takifugu rubripes TaxID=31033 RepID=A0A674N5H2_TAKRU